MTAGELHAAQAAIARIAYARARQARPVPTVTSEDNIRLRQAASRVTKVYPGAIGRLVQDELLSWEKFGYRLGGHRLIMQVVAEVLSSPLPEHPSPAPNRWNARAPGRPWLRAAESGMDDAPR